MNIILQTGIAGMIRKAVNTMALKGSATIELTNADGSKHIVKHDNMITDAVRDLLYAPRAEMSNIMRISDNNSEYAKNIFGGILLFSDVLSEDASDYYIPNLNITGYASQEAYGGLDISRGGYNQSESGLQEDGSYKFVWDFSTSQANGTIKSIALCPSIMGQIGASNTVVASERKDFSLDKSSVAPFDTNNRMLKDGDTFDGISAYYMNIVAIIGNVAYAVNRNNLFYDYNDSGKCILFNGGILKLYRFNIGTESVGIKDRVGMATYMDCIDVQLPEEFISILCNFNNLWIVDYFFDDEGKKLIIYPCGYETPAYLNKNDTTKYVEIDFSDGMKVTTYTFTNNAGDILRRNFSSLYDNGNNSTLFVFKDYVMMVAKASDGKAKLYSAKKSDNTDVKVAKWSSGEEFVFEDVDTRVRYIYSIGDIVVFGIVNGGVQYTSFKNTYMFDMSTGLIKETNASAFTCRSNTPLSNKVTWVKTGAYLYFKIAVCPFVLTTKNNLGTPVTKTASQTMKITYTLSESEVV